MPDSLPPDPVVEWTVALMAGSLVYLLAMAVSHLSAVVR